METEGRCEALFTVLRPADPAQALISFLDLPQVASLPSGLACSFNLGKADIYPATVGEALEAAFSLGFYPMNPISSPQSVPD